MARKRVNLAAQAKEEFKEETPVVEEKKPARKKGSPKEGYVRVRYDMPPELRGAIQKAAYRYGVPASQLAQWFLKRGLADLENGVIDPTPYLQESESPRFLNNLIID